MFVKLAGHLVVHNVGNLVIPAPNLEQMKSPTSVHSHPTPPEIVTSGIGTGLAVVGIQKCCVGNHSRITYGKKDMVVQEILRNLGAQAVCEHESLQTEIMLGSQGIHAVLLNLKH